MIIYRRHFKVFLTAIKDSLMSKTNRGSELKKTSWFLRVLADCNWISTNREYLIKHFPGKVVGIIDGNIVAVADSKTQLLQNPKIGYIKGVSPILWHVPLQKISSQSR